MWGAMRGIQNHSTRELMSGSLTQDSDHMDSQKQKSLNQQGLSLWLILVLLLILIIIIALVVWYLMRQDNIYFTNGSGEKAVLIDGVKCGTFRNDYPDSPPPLLASTDADSIRVGNFEHSSVPHVDEVIAFCQGKVPFLREQDGTFQWSSSRDSVTIAFHDPYPISVAVWIVTTVEGMSSSARARKISTGTDVVVDGEVYHEEGDCEAARRIWATEGQGLVINCGDPKDITDKFIDEDGDGMADDLDRDGRPDNANPYFTARAFDCTEHVDAIKRLGYTPGVLNVYYVMNIVTDFGDPAFGLWCNTSDPPDVIAIGAYASNVTLVHELGHSFLANGEEDHVDSLSSFDKANVMHGKSGERNYLTEGQVFRAFFNAGSALNHLNVYNIGPGRTPLLRRPRGGASTCGPSTDNDNDLCPPVQKRIWKDGGENGSTWPPN